MIKFYPVLFFLFLLNCISQQPHVNREQRRPFDPAEYKYIKINGSATLNGKIFVPTRNGENKPGAGSEITLNPATSYSEEFYIKSVQNGIPIEEADLRVLKYIKKTVADDSGKFDFKNISAGKYYIYAPIEYEIPQPSGGYRKTNTYVYTTAYIRKGQTSDILLTR